MSCITEEKIIVIIKILFILYFPYVAIQRRSKSKDFEVVNKK